jgi:hypothetical protein
VGVLLNPEPSRGKRLIVYSFDAATSAPITLWILEVALYNNRLVFLTAMWLANAGMYYPENAGVLH